MPTILFLSKLPREEWDYVINMSPWVSDIRYPRHTRYELVLVGNLDPKASFLKCQELQFREWDPLKTGTRIFTRLRPLLKRQQSGTP